MTNQRLAILLIAAITALVGCNNSGSHEDNEQHNEDGSASVDASQPSTEPTGSSTANNTSTETPRAINWENIKSDQPAIDPAAYDYPFAIDSQNVKNYADFHNIDNAAAQHSLTVGMASNEALSKVLDEVGSSYVSHNLRDGADIALVIHTTDDIKADRFDYVLADDFAKGLVLPIEIVPDGVKGDAAAQNPHQ